jgi:hypothetical protein
VRNGGFTPRRGFLMRGVMDRINKKCRANHNSREAESARSGDDVGVKMVRK